VQYINMKTTARLCSKCFYPHAWRIFKSFGFASGLPQQVGVYERVDWAKRHAEGLEKLNKKDEGLFKVHVDERLAFVHVDALEKRDGGIGGTRGHGVDGGDVDRRWAGGSAWE
jgi:hypothetical protein